MTNAVHKASMRILSESDLCSFAKRLCEKEGIDPEKYYPKTTDSEVMKSAARRMMYVTQTAGLLRRAIFLGATLPEVLCISEYLIVLLNSVEKELDYKRCASELNISGLEKKYGKDEFFSMDADMNALLSVLKRDKDYYGVTVK